MRILPILEAAEPQLAWDTVWSGTAGDFAGVEGDSATGNRGGLVARAPLETAVVLALMTDRAVDPAELPAGEDNRGWPGDAISLEPGAAPRPMGSKLWLLRRATVDETAARRAEAYAREALQPLVDVGAVASVTALATADPARGRVDLEVGLYERSGVKVVARRFALLWPA